MVKKKATGTSVELQKNSQGLKEYISWKSTTTAFIAKIRVKAKAAKATKMQMAYRNSFFMMRTLSRESASNRTLLWRE